MRKNWETMMVKYSPYRKDKWIFIVFLVKILFFFSFYPIKMTDDGIIGVWGGDTESYFSPIENLITNGVYSPDYRMPGYGCIYLLLRWWLTKGLACNVIIIMQWVLSSLSVYYLAKSVYMLTQKYFLFLFVFFLFLFSTTTNTLDYFLLTESFTTSSLIFACYFFIKYVIEKNNLSVLWSGVFLCWAYFMRPIMLPLFLVFVVILLIGFCKKQNLKKIFFATSVFCIPFIVCENAWVARNYIAHKKIILLTTTQYPLDLENTYYNELMGFMIAWGGDRTWWNPEAEIRWFVNNEKEFGSYIKEPPGYIYTRSFNRDSLLNVKNKIALVENSSVDTVSKRKLSMEIRNALKKYTLSIKLEKPFLYYFKSKLYMIKKFIVHSGTPLLFNKRYSELNFFGKTIKIIYSVLYWFIIIFGILGIALSFLYRQTVVFRLFPIIGLYLLLIYPLIGHFEYRYLIPTYPFLLVCACYALYEIIFRVLPTSYRQATLMKE